ncbi:uncharacterized protein PHACADRAFT_259195 [Phanerochaete carnosa HHB-10118-sp]|uniref:Uncharacterized protein n=1 Tax=Phanerochaete carnosa (strain HHB-10118-sp) TaxID=650164 RepID=K5WRL2_PHACS|nr:uncharacterized protein PHACADRAFT_259195 [Phanerochaete carnosa HHB-10118-sp]EKM53022.1 hypothetical protein PHACADRAFT_259195 [Phanerochaete carnosa HHB-10118-sp]
MAGHRAFGYKLTYQWILDRAKKMGMEPVGDSADARADVMVELLTILAAQSDLSRYVAPVSVKGKDVIAFCLASTDPTNGLPRRVTDAESIEKLRQMIGVDGPPNWWWED